VWRRWRRRGKGKMRDEGEEESLRPTASAAGGARDSVRPSAPGNDGK